jgi:hypothetical protein
MALNIDYSHLVAKSRIAQSNGRSLMYKAILPDISVTLYDRHEHYAVNNRVELLVKIVAFNCDVVSLL